MTELNGRDLGVLTSGGWIAPFRRFKREPVFRLPQYSIFRWDRVGSTVDNRQPPNGNSKGRYPFDDGLDRIAVLKACVVADASTRPSETTAPRRI